MSNNPNYIQETENVQQTTKKYWSYIYEIRHIPTGKLYVGSRFNKKYLKKFEDCYTDKYLGSSCREEGPFSKIDTEINPQNYQKTVLKVFYDEDPKIAIKHEHGENGLIMTYWNLYGHDKVLNQHCILNDGTKIFSTAGHIHSKETKQKISKIHKNKILSKETKQKISNATKGKNNPMYGKNPFKDKSENELLTINQNKKDTWDKKTDEQMIEHAQKISNSMKGKNKGKIFSEKHKQNLSNSAKCKKQTRYYCPYNPNYISDGAAIAKNIKKNYPNEKQWSDFTKEEKKSYLVVSQNDAGCIQNKN